jgi:hypothetical protein
VLDLDSDDAASLYPRKLLLSRPDRHVAWRGDRQPDDPVALIDQLRGALRLPPSLATSASAGPDFRGSGFVPSAERPVEIGEVREAEIERD